MKRVRSSRPSTAERSVSRHSRWPGAECGERAYEIEWTKARGGGCATISGRCRPLALRESNHRGRDAQCDARELFQQAKGPVIPVGAIDVHRSCHPDEW